MKRPWQRPETGARAHLCRQYEERYGGPPNLVDPSSYTGILFKQLVSRECMDPLRQLVSDKEHVKLYVAALAGDAYNIETYAILRAPEEIAVYAFPPRCVIKPTHHSGLVIVRRNAHEPVDRETLGSWFGKSLYLKRSEGNYRYLKPKILVEELLDQAGHAHPCDYKLYCFHGRPAIVQVDFDRLAGHQTGHRRAFYSTRWERLPCEDNQASFTDAMPRPAQLDEMVEVARRLSQAFSFIRVDLYLSAAGIKVGELTNYPGTCLQPFEPPEVDQKLGRLFSEPDLDVLKLLT